MMKSIIDEMFFKQINLTWKFVYGAKTVMISLNDVEKKCNAVVYDGK